jgi:hypothetical protein
MKICHKNVNEKNVKWKWKLGLGTYLSGRVSANHVQGPGFYPQTKKTAELYFKNNPICIYRNASLRWIALTITVTTICVYWSDCVLKDWIPIKKCLQLPWGLDIVICTLKKQELGLREVK